MNDTISIESQTMDADIVCVGYGPATAGFLYTLSLAIQRCQNSSNLNEVRLPQVICYERADDLSFGVSGVVTKARGIRKSIPDIEAWQIPSLTEIQQEELTYMLDPIGASHRNAGLKATDCVVRNLRKLCKKDTSFIQLPYIPEFLHKRGGLTFSLGQFCQWIAAKTMEMGYVQIWPSSPVAHALFENRRMVGIQLMDQGVDLQGNPDSGFMPGTKVRAGLTVIGDGPTGIIGRETDQYFGYPENYSQDDWAVGMKLVVALPETTKLEPGTVFHTFGYPEPEIFGFMYVQPNQIASLGIFVPSWFKNPVRTSYRYMQHWMQHPYLWRYLRGGVMKSWGAKSLQESGRRAEPFLVGDGFARIGEGSGTTNILTGSGVDEAWESGVLLADAVMELWLANKPFNRENLERTYVARRRQSWLEEEARIAERARDGFSLGMITGLIGMGVSGLTKGRINLPHPNKTRRSLPNIETYFQGRISAVELAELRRTSQTKGKSIHDALMEKTGWPPIQFDGQLLMSHQDALLIGGKVQAMPGSANHVRFVYPRLCQECGSKLCVEICSGQALTPGPEGVPAFEREKCVHCGACYWSCQQSLPEDDKRRNLEFKTGPGGLHSAEN